MRPRRAFLPALLGGFLALGVGTLPHRPSPPGRAVNAASAAVAPRRASHGGAAKDSTALTPRAMAFLDTLEERSFRYFWDLSDPETGLTPDRAPTPSFVSVGAMGFALTAYPIGAERGYISRAAAAERVLRTLSFLWSAQQDSAASGVTGYKGFFYHFLDPKSGTRFEKVELSTMDTALLLAGALFCQSYFDRDDPGEARIRALADSVYSRVDWTWAQPRPPTIALGWTPESGFLPYDWRGYNEALLLHVLALGRSEEHTSELQSPCNLVCRLLLEKKKKKKTVTAWPSTITCSMTSSCPDI